MKTTYNTLTANISTSDLQNATIKHCTFGIYQDRKVAAKMIRNVDGRHIHYSLIDITADDDIELFNSAEAFHAKNPHKLLFICINENRDTRNVMVLNFKTGKIRFCLDAVANCKFKFDTATKPSHIIFDESFRNSLEKHYLNF